MRVVQLWIVLLFVLAAHPAIAQGDWPSDAIGELQRYRRERENLGACPEDESEPP